MTLVDVWRPVVTKTHISLLYNTVLVMGASILVALSAQIAIPLPFTPVPVTAQTLAVLLIGAVLGSARGALAILTYLAEGAVGLPVFAGGKAGLAWLAGPTGGYLIGFVLAAFVTGYLAERKWDRNIFTSFLAMSIGNVIIFAFGLLILASYVGFDKVLALGFYPFLVGDIVKLVLAAFLLPLGWKAQQISRKI